MMRLLPLLGLVLAGAAYTGENAVLSVHRCVAANGALSYQQQPCPAGGREAQVLELDLRAPPVPVAPHGASPGQPAATPERRRFSGTRRTRIARGRPPAIPDCPPTREHPGDTGLASLKTAWKRHIGLPGETYLKNAGRWPKRCVRR